MTVIVLLFFSPSCRLSKVGIWSGQFVNGVECTWEAFDPATAKWITIEGKVHLGNHHRYRTRAPARLSLMERRN